MEKVIGSLVEVTGHTFDIVYDLFFTTERVIAVSIRHPADIPYQFRSVWQSVFIGSSWAMRKEQLDREKLARERRHATQSLTPDELVKAHSRNFEIRYNQITSVEVRRRLFQSQLRFCVSKSSPKWLITRFNLSKKHIPEAQRLLELVLPSKIKGK
jgi:hypothetical protein